MCSGTWQPSALARKEMILETSFGVIGIEETIFEAMSKLILEAMCVEVVGFEGTIFEAKGKDMIFETKGLEEMGIEETIFEAMGKMIFEARCFEAVGI